MFKVIASEIKKMVSKPGIFVLAILLAIILVLGVFIYQPEVYDDGSLDMGSSFNEIYNNFGDNEQGIQRKYFNQVANSAVKVENYLVEGKSYKEYISGLRDGVKKAISEFSACSANPDILDKYVNEKRTALVAAIETLSQEVIKSVQLGENGSYPVLTDEESLKSFEDYSKEAVTIFNPRDGIIDRNSIADRCSQYENGAGAQMNAIMDKLIFVDAPKSLFDNYGSAGSRNKTVVERLAKAREDIDKFISERTKYPYEEQTQKMADLCNKYISICNTYSNLVDSEILSLTFKAVNTSKQMKIMYISSNDAYTVNTNLIRYNYLFEHNLTENEYAHPLTIGTTSNTKINGYDYAYFTLKLFSFIIIAYAIMTACHSIAGEVKEGSMRYLAIRPVSRTTLLFGKLFAVLIMSAVMAIFSTIIALCVGGFYYGMGTKMILTIFNGTTVITLHPIVMILVYLLSMMIELTVYVTIAFLLSCLFKSDLFAVTLMLVLYLLNILIPSFVSNATSWLAFYPFSHISLYSLFGSSVYASKSNFLNVILSAKIFTNTSLWLTLTVVLLIVIVVNFISSRIFKRKEL